METTRSLYPLGDAPDHLRRRAARRAFILDFFVREIRQRRSLHPLLLLDETRERFGRAMDPGAFYHLRRRAWKVAAGTLPPGSRRGARRAPDHPSPYAQLSHGEIRRIVKATHRDVDTVDPECQLRPFSRLLDEAPAWVSLDAAGRIVGDPEDEIEQHTHTTPATASPYQADFTFTSTPVGGYAPGDAPSPYAPAIAFASPSREKAPRMDEAALEIRLPPSTPHETLWSLLGALGGSGDYGVLALSQEDGSILLTATPRRTTP